MHYVWIQIERHDEQTDTYERIELPDCLNYFEEEERAREYVLGLLLASGTGTSAALASRQVPAWFREAHGQSE